LKLTVCQLPDGGDALEAAWSGMVAHVREVSSDLVLLPEMPFHPWPCATRQVAPAVWQASVEAHEVWAARLSELGAATVVGTRPVIDRGRRFNQGFLWHAQNGIRAVHHKRFLPDEADFWEASWYARGEDGFAVAETPLGGLGFLICTEVWFTEHARAYGRAGARILVCPRATKAETREKWLVGGRAAAIASGAWCLSSNRGGGDWAGCGWLIEPERGDVLAVTSDDAPFVTLDVDLAAADRAKATYPRYVAE